MTVWLGGAAVAGGMVALVVALRVPLARGRTIETPPAAAAAAAAPATAPPYDSAVLARDVFRPSRAPAPLAFDPTGNQPAPPAVQSVPAFAVVGVMLGHVRTAVIRGIPGFEAAQVVTEGEERGGLRVLRIEPAGVTVSWQKDSVRLALPKEGT